MFIEVQFDDKKKKTVNVDNLIDVSHEELKHPVNGNKFCVTLLSVSNVSEDSYFHEKTKCDDFYNDIQNALSGSGDEMATGRVKVMY